MMFVMGSGVASVTGDMDALKIPPYKTHGGDMKAIDEIKVLLKLDGMTWEEEQSVSAMEAVWV